MAEAPNRLTERKADYTHIPDHSDLRGFSYRAPSRFDYRDETKKPASFWQKLLGLFGRKS